MKVLSAVLLLVGVLVCYSYGEDTPCSKFPDGVTEEQKTKLDLDRFVKITWHEIKTVGTRYGDGDCTSIKYEKVAKKDEIVEHVKTTYTQYKEKKKGDVTMYLKSKATDNKYEDSFDAYNTTDFTKNKVDDLHYQILTTDYEKYALVYGCNVKDKVKTERMAMLSSTATLEKADEDKMIVTLGLVEPTLAGKTWSDAVVEDNEKCSASIFGLSTLLTVIVAMLLVLRN